MRAIKPLSRVKTGFLPKAGKEARKAVLLSEIGMPRSWFESEELITVYYPIDSAR